MLCVSNEKLVKYLAITLTIMVCITRISMAAGEIMLGISVLIGLVLFYKERNEIKLSNEIKGYCVAALVLFLCTVPSVILGENPVNSIREFLNMWIWRFSVFILIVFFIKKRLYLVNMLYAFLVVFGVDCLTALYQVVTHMTDRGWGFGSNMLAIAGIMCMVFPIVLVILCDKRFDRKLKHAAVFTLTCTIIGLLSNNSRGAWLTCFVVGPVAAWKYIIQHVKYILAFVLVIGVVTGFFMSQPTYSSRLLSVTNMTTNTSNTHRLLLWRSCIDMYVDHPVGGIGLGNFQKIYENRYRYPDETEHLSHAHNNFMHLLAETGTFGAVGYIGFVLYFLFTSFKNWRRYQDPYDILIFTTVLSFMGLFGQIEYIIDNSSAVRIFWFLLAVLLQMKQSDKKVVDSSYGIDYLKK